MVPYRFDFTPSAPLRSGCTDRWGHSIDETELVTRCNAICEAEGRNMAEFGTRRVVDLRLTSIE